MKIEFLSFCLPYINSICISTFGSLLFYGNNQRCLSLWICVNAVLYIHPPNNHNFLCAIQLFSAYILYWQHTHTHKDQTFVIKSSTLIERWRYYFGFTNLIFILKFGLLCDINKRSFSFVFDKFLATKANKIHNKRKASMTR